MTAIPGPQAWRQAAARSRQWDRIAPRFQERFFTVEHTPKFALNRTDRFFCLGSCFARNVEEHLIYRGAQVLSKRIVTPIEEYSARPNGCVNKFTTHSMMQELHWLVEPPAWGAALLETQGGWIDLQLAPGLVPVTQARALERRTYLTEDYFARIRQADVMVLTLGLNEVWFDHQTELYLNRSPGPWDVRRQADRFELRVTDSDDNIAALETLHGLLKAQRPDSKIIVTVSPVPMGDTFSGRDIALANTYSKSVLRVAAQAFADRHEDVDYFPSFEMVSLSPRASAYAADCLHVTNDAVNQVMGVFFEAYMGGAEPIEPGFIELAYLDAHPDVEAAVRAGVFESGFQHWLEYGRQEGRALAPAAPSDRLVALGG